MESTDSRQDPAVPFSRHQLFVGVMQKRDETEKMSAEHTVFVFGVTNESSFGASLVQHLARSELPVAAFCSDPQTPKRLSDGTYVLRLRIDVGGASYCVEMHRFLHLFFFAHLDVIRISFCIELHTEIRTFGGLCLAWQLDSKSPEDQFKKVVKEAKRDLSEPEVRCASCLQLNRLGGFSLILLAFFP